MSRSSYKFSVSEGKETIDKWIADLRELQVMPYKATVELEALLNAAFADTQARTHVLTGSLKASGKTDSDFDGDEWSGSITYGGELWRTPAPGPPNDPVVYAIYEMARGGEHDFFAGLPGFEDRVGDILNEFFPEG